MSFNCRGSGGTAPGQPAACTVTPTAESPPEDRTDLPPGSQDKCHETGELGTVQNTVDLKLPECCERGAVPVRDLKAEKGLPSTTLKFRCVIRGTLEGSSCNSQFVGGTMRDNEGNLVPRILTCCEPQIWNGESGINARCVDLPVVI